MATIRERVWVGRDGAERRRWQCDFVDVGGRRRHRQFKARRAADQFLITTLGQVQAGTFSAESSSPRLSAAIAAWLARGEAEWLERGTLVAYRRHAAHIQALMPDNPKLARITQGRVEAFRDAALTAHSRAMARKILGAFKSVLRDAKRRGLIAVNAAAETTIGAAKRHKRKLKVGVDVPFPTEVVALLGAAGSKAKAIVALAARAGLRASELRGLAWSSVDLGARPAVTVAQRADQWAVLGSPKSESSQRTVPLSAETARALREWKLAQAPGRVLVFGTSSDRPATLGNLQTRLLTPLCAAAGVRRYTWHSLRHYAISSWLASGIDLKTAQTWAGHSSAVVTANVYGHFIPRADDHARIEAAERSLLSN